MRPFVHPSSHTSSPPHPTLLCACLVSPVALSPLYSLRFVIQVVIGLPLLHRPSIPPSITCLAMHFLGDTLQQEKPNSGRRLLRKLFLKTFPEYGNEIFIAFKRHFLSVHAQRLQTGQLKTAYTLLEERLEMEEKQLGMRDEDMADIYQLMSKCKSEVTECYCCILK